MDRSEKMPQGILRPLRFSAFVMALFLGGIAIWAIRAPIATTLHLQGQIVSAKPSFDVQHVYGGQIQDVLVSPHAHVQKGAVMFRLDTRLDQANLDSLTALEARLRAENAVIRALLAGHRPPPSSEGAAFVLRAQQADMQVVLKSQTVDSLTAQQSALLAGIDHAQEQLDLMHQRAARQEILANNGRLSQTAVESLQEQILIVAAELQTDQAELIALKDQVAQTRSHQSLIELSLAQELNATLQANLKQLEELLPAKRGHQDRIEKAQIHAPIAGTVTRLNFEAEGMFAPRGATLLSLAQALDAPHVAFRVPVGLIDQMRVGQSGTLIITSLPQRQLPQIRVTVRAISPRAQENDDGVVLGYDAIADIAQSDLSAVQSVLGDNVSLSADMPVELLIEGRKITLAQYLVAPFFKSFENALQD